MIKSNAPLLPRIFKAKGKPDSRTEPLPKISAFKISALYALVGGLWILFSDRLLALLCRDFEVFSHLQTLKGWFYVAATAWMLYVLIRYSQEELRESKRTLATLLSNLPGMAFRCRADRDWTMEFVSAGCLHLTGYPPSDLIHNAKVSFAQLIYTEDREYLWKEMQKALREERPFQFISRMMGAAGEEKWVWMQGCAVLFPEGQLPILEGFITDITTHKLAEDALRESEEKHRTLVESSSDAIILADRERRIVSFNRAFLELFGFESHEVQGESIRMIHPSEESYRFFGRKAFAAIERTGSFRTEWELMHRDGTLFPVDAVLSGIRDSDGSIRSYVAIIRDITERKAAEAELKKHRNHLEEVIKERTLQLESAQKALVQKEKLKTLGAISAEVAHEIRNPLVSIGGFARRLQKKYPDSLEADIILKESQRLENILNRIRDYLKPIEMLPRECSVNSVLTDCLTLLSVELEREHVSLRLDLDPGLHSAYTDPSVMCEIIVNLVRNAAKDIDKGKALTIKTSESELHITIELRSPGLAPRTQNPETLFLPFDECAQSTGVPLSCRLIEEAGGLLSFAQEQDDAVIAVSLPRVPQPIPRGA